MFHPNPTPVPTQGPKLQPQHLNGSWFNQRKVSLSVNQSPTSNRFVSRGMVLRVRLLKVVGATGGALGKALSPFTFFRGIGGIGRGAKRSSPYPQLESGHSISPTTKGPEYIAIAPKGVPFLSDMHDNTLPPPPPLPSLKDHCNMG